MEENLNELQQLQLALKASRTVAWVWHIESNTVTHSENVTELLGLPPVTNVSAVLAHVHPEDIDVLRAAINYALKNRSEYHYDFRFIHPGAGNLIWLHNRAKVECDASGHPIRLIGTVTDVTERKQAEEALKQREQQLQILTDAAPAAISYIDKDQTYRFVNHQYEEWFGIPRQEMIGKSMTELLGESAMQRLRPYVERALKGEEVRFEEEITYRNRDRRWIDAHYAPERAPDGHVRGFFVLVLDISERKIRELNTQLLASISDILARSARIEDIFQNFAAEISKHMGLTELALCTIHPSGSIEKNIYSFSKSFPVAEKYFYPNPLTNSQIEQLQNGESIRFITFASSSMLAIPYLISGRLQYVLFAQRQNLNEWREDEASIVRGVAERFWARLERAQSEDLLKQYTNQLAIITNTAPVFIAHCDIESRYLFVNDSYAARFGLKPEDCIGKRIPEIVGENAYESLRPYVERALQGESVEFEIEVPYEEIGPLFMRCSYAPEFNSEGSVAGFVAAIIDITERRNAEQELRKTTEQFQVVTNLVPAIVWTAPAEGKPDYANEQWYELTGYVRGIPVAETFFEAIHPDDRDRAMQLWESAQQSGTDYEVEIRLRTRAGVYLWFLVRAIPYRNSEGDVLRWFGMSTDITERKTAERDASYLELLGEIIRQASEEETLLNQICELTVRHFEVDLCAFSEPDLQNSVAFINYEFRTPRVSSILGTASLMNYPEERLNLLKDGLTVATEDLQTDPLTTASYESVYRPRGIRSSLIQPVLQNGLWVATIFMIQSSPRKWFKNEIDLMVSAAERVWLAIQKMRGEKALRTAEERMRLALQVGTGGSWDMDLRTGTLYWSETHFTLLGYKPDPSGIANIELWRKAIHEEDLPRVNAEVERSLEHGMEYHCEYRIRRADNGEIRWLEAVGQHFFDSKGIPRRFIGVFFDITDRKAAEEALKQQQRFTQNIIEASPSLTYIFDLVENRNVFISSQTIELLGYTPEEIQAMGSEVLSILLHPDDMPRARERFRRIQESPADKIFELEYRMRRKNGSWVWLLSRDRVIARNNHGIPTQILGVVTDITERKRRQLHTEFLASLSEGLEQISIPEKIMQIVSQKVCSYFEVSCCFFSELVIGKDEATVIYQWPETGGLQVHQVYRLLDYVSPEVLNLLASGKQFVVSEASIDPRILSTSEMFIRLGAVSFVTSVYQSEGSSKALFTVQSNLPCEWQQDELDLMNEIAARVWPRIERAQSEQALRESEERFRVMADYAPMMVWVSDAEGNCNFLSQTWFNFTGQSPEQGLGLGWLNVIHPEDKDLVEQTFLSSNELRVECSVEYRLRHADGNYRWVIDSALPRFNSSGEFIGYIGSIVDIDERKREEIRLALLAQVSEYARTMIDPGELIFAVSKAAGERLQASRCLFDEIDVERDLEIVHRDFHQGLPSVAGAHKISDYSSVTSKEIQTGKTIVNYDSKVDPRTAKDYHRSYEAAQERAYIAVPLFRDSKWVATFWVSDHRPRQWTRQEVSLVENIAERTWAAVEKLRIDARLRESQQEFEALVWTSAQIVWEADQNGMIVSDSITWREFTGQSFAEMKGEGWLDSLHPEDRSRVKEEWESAVKTRKQFETEYRLLQRRQQWRWMIARGTPLIDAEGVVHKWVGMNVDITERKLAEESLRESQQRLKQALAAAEEASRLKDEFLATLSHELRTPLNSILGWSHMLQANSLEPEVAATATNAIYTSAKNQAQIIDDLLDVARITSGKMKLHPGKIELGEIMDAAINIVSHAITAKNLQLQTIYEEDCDKVKLYADPQRLQQVFWNLLSNAVKFTPAGGAITVHARRSEDEIIIDFCDTGIGITPEFLPLVFERFRQADSSSIRKFGGLGLGLSIARQMVELHGGTISVDSKGEGQGTVFTIHLPLTVEHLSARKFGELKVQDRTADRIILPHIKVLVVDDDIRTLELLRESIELSGAEFRGCKNTEDAIQTAQAWLPDLLISDIAMPDHDGYWLIRKLRALPDPLCTIPAIALTAYASPIDRAKVLSAGFQMFVSKPVEPPELLGTMKALLEQKKLSNEESRKSNGESLSTLSGKKILLVEDDLLSAEVFRHAFEKEGLEFRSVMKAADALTMLQNWLPDIIVSDLGLPDEDGYTLIKKIRSIPAVENARIPAVALTGYGNDEGLRAVAAGFQLYVSKPILPDDLISLLNELVKTHS